MFSLVFVGSSSLVRRPVSFDGQWAAATAWTWGTASMQRRRRIFKGDKKTSPTKQIQGYIIQTAEMYSCHQQIFITAWKGNEYDLGFFHIL